MWTTALHFCIKKQGCKKDSIRFHQSINAISIQLNILMSTLYYLTVMIFLAVPSGPPTGWIQYTEGYHDKAVCETRIHLMEPQLRLQIQAHFGKKLQKVGVFECATREEVVKRNTALGH